MSDRNQGELNTGLHKRRVIRSLTDAYDYLTTGSEKKFHILDAVSLYLLESEVRGTLKVRRENAGLPYENPTTQEIDEIIRTDYNVSDLDKMQERAFSAIEKYTRETHLNYTIEEILNKHVIEQYLVPILKGKSLFGIPIGVWQGMLGNIFTILIVVFAACLVSLDKYFNRIDLVSDILSFLGIKM